VVPIRLIHDLLLAGNRIGRIMKDFSTQISVANYRDLFKQVLL